MKISQYPHFEPIELKHFQFLSEFTSAFDPYSDFNFTSLYSWSYKDNTSISLLNENLVIKLPDYITGREIVSILGKDDIQKNIFALLGDREVLDLVPEVVVKQLKDDGLLKITEDEKNHDYIYSVKDIAFLEGGKYKNKRHKAARFIRNNPTAKITTLNLQDSKIEKIIIDIFEDWTEITNTLSEEAEAEKIAISRLLKAKKELPIEIDFIMVEEIIKGFSIHERIDKDMLLCHFHKSITSYRDMDVYFTSSIYKKFYGENFKLVNWEQDLGIDGLKHTKQSYLPEKLLRKYSITKL